MLIEKLPSNKFTKRTDANFKMPYFFSKLLLDNLFVPKKNWIENNLIKETSFYKDLKLKQPISKIAIKNIRLVYTLFWSSAKRFI